VTEWTELQTMLASADEETRLDALRRLPAGDTDAALQLILQALGDSSWRVRKQAVELYLQRTDVDQSAGKVVEQLYSSDNAGLRNAAVEILIRLGSVVTRRMIAETHSADHDVRKFAIDILGGISDSDCTSALIDALRDPDENVRAAAAENLGNIGSDAAVPALLNAMESADLLSRFTILEAIGRIGRPVAIAELLPYKDDQLLRKPLFECLGRVGDAEAFPVLMEGIISGPANASEAAIVALQQLVERCGADFDSNLSVNNSRLLAQTLGNFFSHNKREIRRSAVNLLGLLRDCDNAEKLLDLLSDEEVQDNAFKALVALGSDGAERLAEIWLQVDVTKQSYIAYLFGQTAYRKGVPLLLEAISSSDPQLREIAAGALGKVGDADALKSLINLFSDEVDRVRDAATEAVIRLGGAYTQLALEEIRTCLDHADAATRMAAVAALGRLGGVDATEVLLESLKDVSPQVRQAAVRAFTPSRDETTIEAIALALMDEDAGVRRLAVEKLGMCADLVTLSPLKLALADDDVWVRSAAVRAIGLIGGAAQLPVIERLLFDPVGLVSIAVLDTVEKIVPEQVNDLFTQALEHPDHEVVIAAIHGLVRNAQKDVLSAKSTLLSAHRSVEVRTALYRALAELAGNEALSILTIYLEREQDALAREQLLSLIDNLKAAHGL